MNASPTLIWLENKSGIKGLFTEVHRAQNNGLYMHCEKEKIT